MLTTIFKEILPEFINAGKEFIRENPKETIAAGILVYAGYQTGCNKITTSELEYRKMECRELRNNLLLQNSVLLEAYVKNLLQTKEFQEMILQYRVENIIKELLQTKEFQEKIRKIIGQERSTQMNQKSIADKSESKF